MTTREQLIEAAAKAIYLQRNGHGGTAWEKINTQHREPYRKDVRAVATAIEAAGLCIVPVEATAGMLDDIRLAKEQWGKADAYRTMIDAGKL